MLRFADAVAGEDHLVARLEREIRRRDDPADEVDAGDEWGRLDDAGAAGYRHAVLVIDVGVLDLDIDRPLTARSSEEVIVELAQLGGVFGDATSVGGLFNDDGAKAHVQLLWWRWSSG